MENLPLKYGAIMRRGFAPAVAIIALALIAIFSGSFLVAWRTSILDQYLPQAVKEFFRKTEIETSGTPITSDNSEPSSEDSETTAEDPTKDWETYTNTELGFSFKYPRDWALNENESTVLSLSSPNGNSLSFYENFQGGRGEPIRFEERYYETLDGSEVYTTIYYGLDGDDKSVVVDGTFYPKLTEITFIYEFDLNSSANGLEILSLILSTFKFL